MKSIKEKPKISKLKEKSATMPKEARSIILKRYRRKKQSLNKNITTLRQVGSAPLKESDDQSEEHNDVVQQEISGLQRHTESSINYIFRGHKRYLLSKEKKRNKKGNVIKQRAPDLDLELDSDSIPEQATSHVPKIQVSSPRNRRVTSNHYESGRRQFSDPKEAAPNSEILKRRLKQHFVRNKQLQNTSRQNSKGILIKSSAKVFIENRKRAAVVIKHAVQSALALFGGSGLLLVVILIFAASAALIASPFGLFFSSEDVDNANPEVIPITTIVQEVNQEFDERIQDILSSVYYDSYTITHLGSADNTRVINWMDVAAVFAVKTTTVDGDASDVVTMDLKRKEKLKSVFWDMNHITYFVKTIHHDDWTEYILHITVSAKTAATQAEDYGFNAAQKNLVAQMLSAEFRPYMFALLGLDYDTGLTPEELQDILENLPDGDIGAALVALALTRLGDPYSQPLAGQQDYVDCSYLIQWCYAQLGVTVPRTAAEQARFCENNGQSIKYENLQPGDLVFWSFETNGRYKDIGHMGIYAGGGKVIDASYSKQMVVYRDLYSPNSVVLFGRLQ